jgi:hypothetical protein
MAKHLSSPIRLALRTEGDWWVAYLAEATTMDGAREVGRILLGAASQGNGIRERWMSLMSDVMRIALEDMGVTVASMDERPAPESERSGRA